MSNQREYMLRVRMNPQETAHLDQLAGEAGLSRSEVVRELINTGKVSNASARQAELNYKRQRLALIGRANANLNMIAKWANTYKEGAYSVEIIAQLIAVERELIDILNELK